MVVSLREAFELAEAKAQQRRCQDCQNAHVGAGERCHCHEGHWKDKSLAQVARLRTACDDFEEA